MENLNPELAFPFFEEARQIQVASEDWEGLVITLIQAGQAYINLNQKEYHAIALEIAAQLEELGPQFPPPDPGYITYVPGLIAAKTGNWLKAEPLFWQTLTRLEQIRADLPSAEHDRVWFTQRAVLYGNMIEMAIKHGAGLTAINFLELARHRFLSRTIGNRARQLTSNGTIEPYTRQQLDRLLPHGCTFVWVGGFPRGVGVVAAQRDLSGEMIISTGYSTALKDRDLIDLYRGEIYVAAEQGRGVEYIFELVKVGGRARHRFRPGGAREGVWQLWKSALDRIPG